MKFNMLPYISDQNPCSQKEVLTTLTCSFSNCIIFLKKSTENGRLSCKLKKNGRMLFFTMTESLSQLTNVKDLQHKWFNEDLAGVNARTGP
jgi:hypothetical protein